MKQRDRIEKHREMHVIVTGSPEVQPNCKKHSKVLSGSSEMISLCAIFRGLSKGIRERGEPDIMSYGRYQHSM